MEYLPRKTQVERLFPDLPRYRWRQIERALLDPTIRGWGEVTVLPKPMRQTLALTVPWLSHQVVQTFTSRRNDTHKAVLQAHDGQRFETVLMANARGHWTLCVSSQIGCAMRCSFCATGTMGLKRSLHADEIVDQYRWWQGFLHDRHGPTQRISNMVFMGMGEPLANYENVKAAIHTLIAAAGLGPTRITVSTVGILTVLDRILTDPDWPPVRIAISLHSANAKLRPQIVPSSVPNFLPRLADWSRRYHATLGNRRHYLTFEYILLNQVNDTPSQAEELAAYLRTTGAKKINVIPYNPVLGKPFAPSQAARIANFKAILRAHDVDVTQRKTMGDDIAAACGQLVYQNHR